jgi:hypothetical protein
MTTIHLGVHDFYYGDTGLSTGDVAKILEARYGIMQAFWDRNVQDIARLMEESYAKAIKAVIAGADPSKISPAAGAASKIERMFKESLAAKAYDQILPGVPTKAALLGVSHRKAMPYAKYKYRGGKRTKVRRPSRPSFIDTGLYQNSFTMWMD